MSMGPVFPVIADDSEGEGEGEGEGGHSELVSLGDGTSRGRIVDVVIGVEAEGDGEV